MASKCDRGKEQNTHNLKLDALSVTISDTWTTVAPSWSPASRSCLTVSMAHHLVLSLVHEKRCSLLAFAMALMFVSQCQFSMSSSPGQFCRCVWLQWVVAVTKCVNSFFAVSVRTCSLPFSLYVLRICPISQQSCRRTVKTVLSRVTRPQRKRALEKRRTRAPR